MSKFIQYYKSGLCPTVFLCTVIGVQSGVMNFVVESDNKNKCYDYPINNNFSKTGFIFAKSMFGYTSLGFMFGLFYPVSIPTISIYTLHKILSKDDSKNK